MPFTWEVKSSWVGVGITYPGRVICFMGMILHQLAAIEQVKTPPVMKNDVGAGLEIA